MKVVSENLGVARSQLTARLKQLPPGPQPRRRRTRNDAALVEQIKQAVGALNSYGYRRVWGLLRRQHERQALPPVNVKRMYCVMRDHDLLLERRRKQPGVARRYEGRVAVDTSNRADPCLCPADRSAAADHAGMQPAEQRHGGKLREDHEARLPSQHAQA